MSATRKTKETVRAFIYEVLFIFFIPLRLTSGAPAVVEYVRTPCTALRSGMLPCAVPCLQSRTRPYIHTYVFSGVERAPSVVDVGCVVVVVIFVIVVGFAVALLRGSADVVAQISILSCRAGIGGVGSTAVVAGAVCGAVSRLRLVVCMFVFQ